MGLSISYYLWLDRMKNLSGIALPLFQQLYVQRGGLIFIIGLPLVRVEASTISHQYPSRIINDL